MPEFPRTTPLTLVVRIPSGCVEVVAEERESAEVDVEPYGGSESSRELAERTQVELHGDMLTIAAPEVSGGWLFRRSGGLSVHVRVPIDSSVQLKVASAEATCHGRYARVTAETASGDVRVEHVTGDATFKTASGDVWAGRVDGLLTIHGASGDVRAQHAGGAVEAKVASGNVEIEDAGSAVRVKTASGRVRVGTARRGTTRISTASGDVTVGVLAGTGVWLDLNTVSGTTHNGLDMAGGGAAVGHDLTLEVRTASGDIEVRRAA